MPLNSNMLRIKASKTGGARTSTVMMSGAGPTVSGSSPNFDENHMDKEMIISDSGMSQEAFDNFVASLPEEDEQSILEA